MSVTPKQAARFLVNKRKQEEKALDARFDAMSSDAKRIISFMARNYYPKRIYQWGSLLNRSRFRSWSDINIAVEGIEDTRTWLEIEAEVWDLTVYPLDLVRLERIEPEYAGIIRQKGVVVYERPD